MRNDTVINAQNLKKEFAWLAAICRHRLNQSRLSSDKQSETDELPPPPVLESAQSVYAGFVNDNAFSPDDRLLLALALAPHLVPDLLDRQILTNATYVSKRQDTIRNDTALNEIGGIKGQYFQGFIPTGLTWLFLLAGYDIQKRMLAWSRLNDQNLLLKEEIISFSPAPAYEPVLSGGLIIGQDWLRFLTIGDIPLPVRNKNNTTNPS